MATEFSELYARIRTWVGDTDLRKTVYQDRVLDNHIRNVISTYESNGIVESGNTASFTLELSNAQKAIVIAEVAIAIISNSPVDFSFSDPAIKYRKKMLTGSRLSQLQTQLSRLQATLVGGSSVAVSEGVFSAILDGPTKIQDELS